MTDENKKEQEEIKEEAATSEEKSAEEVKEEAAPAAEEKPAEEAAPAEEEKPAEEAACCCENELLHCLRACVVCKSLPYPTLQHRLNGREAVFSNTDTIEIFEVFANVHRRRGTGR